MIGERVKAQRNALGITMDSLGKLSGAAPRFICEWEGGKPPSNRVRKQIISTLAKLRALKSRWEGIPLDMRNVEEVRKLLTAMGDEKPVTIPQDTDIGDIAKACIVLAMSSVELNRICGLRGGLLTTAKFFSRPCQRWVKAHVVAVRDVLSGLPDFFAKHSSRSEAIEALAERVRVKLEREIGTSQHAEYLAALRLTGESIEAEAEENANAN